MGGAVFTTPPQGAEKDHCGKTSANAAKKIRKAVDWLVLGAKRKRVFVRELGKEVEFRINFITLTLPAAQGEVTDVEVKHRALNLFLTNMRERFGMVNYIWRAEAQENGNIHFHITTDVFIHWGDIRRVWNSAIHKLGYVAAYRESMKQFHANGFRVREDLLKHWPREAQHKAYMYGCQTDWSNPNTTDVHAVSRINNLAGYLSKYMTKNDESRRPIKGRLWGMSQNLSKIIRARFECVEAIPAEDRSSYFTNSALYKASDYGVTILAKASDYITHARGSLQAAYRQIIEWIQNPPPKLTMQQVVFG